MCGKPVGEGEETVSMLKKRAFLRWHLRYSSMENGQRLVELKERKMN